MEARTFYIAGVQHRTGMSECIADLEVGMELNLIPEPENNYDPNAVQICYGDIQLGYVPRKFSAEVSGILEIDEIVCEIVELKPSAKPWEQCKVTVHAKEE